MREELAGGWTLEHDGSAWSPSAEWRILPKDADGDIEIQSAGLSVYVPHSVVTRVVAPSRPWHYVTEKLPEPHTSVIFWVVSEIAHLGPSNEEGGFNHGEAKSAPGWGWRNLSGEPFRCGTAPGEVYAWQPLPAAPPPPTAEASEEDTAGCVDCGEPLSRGEGPVCGACREPKPEPTDPDLLQALKDAARMGRKR